MNERLTAAIQTDQLHLLFKQAPPAFVFLLIVATSMVFVLWSQIDQTILIPWLVIVLFSTVIRLLLISSYHKQQPVLSIMPWRRGFIAITGLSGIIWGIGCLLFLQQLDISYQMFVITMLSGITAGAQATYSSSPINCRMFLLPCLLIPSSWLLLQDETTLRVIGSLSVLYAVLLCVLNTRHFQTLKNSLLLRYKNDALLSDLEQEVAEHKLSAAELLQNNQHMQSLLRLDQALAQTTSHHDIIRVTAFEIEQVLNYSITWLYLPTDKENIWRLFSPQLTEPADVGLNGIITSSSAPIIIADARNDSDLHRDTLKLLNHSTTVIIPMFIANTCLGALATASHSSEGINLPNDSQISLLSAIAAHVALALDRVNQFNDRLKLQGQLEHAQRMDSLGLMAGGIAHDFNNILTSIIGNASLAANELDDTTATRQHLALIQQSGQHAADLCNQMLAYSGKGHFIIETVDLSTTVDSVSSMIDASIGKHINIQYALSQDLLPIKADVTQMQQVIMNLLINASEAVAESGGQIMVTTSAKHADTAMLADCYGESPPAGDYVCLEISDNGCGMDKETADKMFDPFFTTKFTGRGLGMSAILGIVRGHHGAILIDTSPEQGTTFRILLPISSEHPAKEIEKQPQPQQSQENTIKTHNRSTILVIDDEQMVIDIAQKVLNRSNYDVLTAIGGEEALVLYRQHHQSIGLILLDLTMPGMSGKQCFHQLLEINAQARVMIVSGYSEEDAMTQFEGFQMSGFIRKPYMIENFLNDVNQALSARLN